MFSKTMVQGPTCLANVGAGAFITWDAVHHTFPAIGWYWVLGVHKLLPQGPVGTEGNLDMGPGLARTLCCTTVLTVHPSGVIPFLCCYYH